MHKRYQATNKMGLKEAYGSDEDVQNVGQCLVPCGHARFCESCAMRVSGSLWLRACRADITMVMRIYS